MRGPGQYEARALRRRVEIDSTADQAVLFPARDGWLDLEWVAIRFVSGASPVVVQFRDRQDDADPYEIEIGGTSGLHVLHEWASRLEQDTRGQQWTVAVTGGASELVIYAQAREYRIEGKGPDWARERV